MLAGLLCDLVLLQALPCLLKLPPQLRAFPVLPFPLTLAKLLRNFLLFGLSSCLS